MHNDSELPTPSLEHALDLGLPPDEAQEWFSLMQAARHLLSASAELRKAGARISMPSVLKLMALQLETLAAGAEMLPRVQSPEAYEENLADLEEQREQLRAMLGQFPDSQAPELFTLNEQIEALQCRAYVAMGLVPPDFEAELASPHPEVSQVVRNAFGDSPTAGLLLWHLKNPAKS